MLEHPYHLDSPRCSEVHDSARAFWYGLINYEQRAASAKDLKLERMRALLAQLGNPHYRLRIVHVAGSKGKGSTSAMLASILQQAGYRTGLLTSPHLCHVEERFRIDDQPITPNELTVLLEEIRESLPQGPAPSFFEVATAVGFLHFVRRRVDIAVLEVGLGGRYDSTNVCWPMVSLITSISRDHTKQLGHRLEQIAREKAGIIKARRPVLSSNCVAEVRETIEGVARDQHAPLGQLGIDFDYEHQPGEVSDEGIRRNRVRITTDVRTWPDMEVNLLGEHQAKNAALAVACIEELRRQGLTVSDKSVRTGLAKVRWPARMEVVGTKPLVVMDCAHNVASAEAVVRTLESSFPQSKRFLVFAASKDKELDQMCSVLAKHFTHVLVTHFTSNPRAASPDQLAQLFQREQVPVTITHSPSEAWRSVCELATPDDLICITGSVFLAGELRPILEASPFEGSTLLTAGTEAIAKSVPVEASVLSTEATR